MRILRQPILRSYILALFLIGLVVVLLASWFGLYLARGITGPIKLMAEGTQAVAAGNLDHQIPPVGDDEIGHLVRSFNQMTVDLRASRCRAGTPPPVYRDACCATSRRAWSVSIAEGKVTTINPCAERLLGLRAPKLQGRALPIGVSRAALAHALDDLFAARPRPQEAGTSIKLEPGGGENRTDDDREPAWDENGANLGTVLFFEDVSQIAKVERMEAWREVARRIAHEIKNPLTPIQLSAERLKRQFATALRRRRRAARRMHPHHYRRGRRPQAAGQRVLRFRADAASQSRSSAI